MLTTVCREEATGAEIDARRIRNAKSKMRSRLEDAMQIGDLSSVVWLIEHHGGTLAALLTAMNRCAQV